MNKQQGVTLIELMISLLLGLSLLAGISELFVQSQKSNQAQRSLSYMVEDGRYALEMMSKELRRAGYLRNLLEVSNNDLFIGGTDYMNMLGSNPPINLGLGEIIHGGVGDVFVIRYQLNDAQDLADPGIVVGANSGSPCTQDIQLVAGEDPTTSSHVVSIYFYVEQDANNVPTLYCRARRDVVDPASGSVSCVAPGNCSIPNGLPLISNVTKLVVKYGVDYVDNVHTPATSGDGAADYYVDASGINDEDWHRVVSVKVFVVLRSEEDNLLKNNTTYSIENDTYTADDKRIYRMFSTTVAFRN